MCLDESRRTLVRLAWCVSMRGVPKAALFVVERQITRMLVVSSLVADWLQAVLGNGLAPIAKNSPRLQIS